MWPPSSDLKWCWLPLAPFMWGWVLVGVAAFLGRRSRCLRAASAEPTRAYAVEPRQIPRNHLSYSYRFLCITSCTYFGNYDYICRNKLVDNVHIPSHLKNANEHLPTPLAYAKKSRLHSRAPTHAYADCEISGQQPTQLYKEFPRVHEVGHPKKNAAQI